MRRVLAIVLLALLQSAPAAASAADRDRLLELLITADAPDEILVRSAAAVRRQAEAAGDLGAQSMAFSIDCRAGIRRGDLDGAQRACEAARRLAPAEDDLAQFAAERMGGALQIERGQPVAALDSLVAAHAAATRSGNQLAVGSALAAIGAAAQFAGANADAIDYYARAQSVARRVGAHSLGFQVTHNIGVLLREAGDLAGAVEQFESAIAAAAQVGANFDPIATRAALAIARTELGQTTASGAVQTLREIVASPALQRRPAVLAEAQLGLARVELRLGQHTQSEAAVRAAIEGLRNTGPVRAYVAEALLVDVLVAAGNLDEAERVAERAMRVVPEEVRGRAELLEARERLLAARGRLPEAYRTALEVRRARNRQSLTRASNTLSFMRARTEAQERNAEIVGLRTRQAQALEEAREERIVRNLVLALLAATLAAALALWSVARTRRRLATEVERRRSIDALGKLTGGVAHEFNNLMAIVQQAMGLLRRDDAVCRSEQALGLIDEAEGAARLGGDITRQLLAFARKQPTNAELLVLGSHLGTLRQLLEHRLGEGMQLVLEVADAGIRVRVDPGQLATALVNLLGNARDAMDGRGTVTLRIESLENGVRDRRWPDLPPGTYAALSVIDTGRGMSEEVARQATLPFFTTKSTDGGTGLGLSTVLGFASQSGGHLQIESTPAVGTTITLLLPRA